MALELVGAPCPAPEDPSLLRLRRAASPASPPPMMTRIAIIETARPLLVRRKGTWLVIRVQRPDFCGAAALAVAVAFFSAPVAMLAETGSYAVDSDIVESGAISGFGND